MLKLLLALPYAVVKGVVLGIAGVFELRRLEREEREEALAQGTAAPGSEPPRASGGEEAPQAPSA
ncbi:MAG: hypothetical protein NZM07_02150 [Elioraea sp.]|nr:hypothetical protein [Elioraea sp.]